MLRTHPESSAPSINVRLPAERAINRRYESQIQDSHDKVGLAMPRFRLAARKMTAVGVVLFGREPEAGWCAGPATVPLDQLAKSRRPLYGKAPSPRHARHFRMVKANLMCHICVVVMVTCVVGLGIVGLGSP